MTTITIAYEVSDDKVAEIQKHLDWLAINHCDFSGDPLTIERGEYTQVTSGDVTPSHIKLYHKMQEIISGFC